MKVRVGVFTLASLALSLAFSATAADIRPLGDGLVQSLPRPSGHVYTTYGQDVAVDGGYIIVIAGYDGGQQALLYRRNTSDGRWVYRRALVTWAGAHVRAHVAMRNGIAAVQFSDQITLFELSGGDYVQATSAAPIRHHGGLAISANRVLIGGDNCTYDAVIYQKGTNGVWDITGRLDDNQGACLDASYDYNVELNYDYAILNEPYGREGRAWRRNGTAVDWVPAGTLPFLPDEAVAVDSPFALQGTTAVGPNGIVWRRTGTSTWARQGQAISVDHDDGYGITVYVAYRDGVLVTSEYGRYNPFPHVYLEPSPGRFEHVASMPIFDATSANILDISGRTGVAAVRDSDGSRQEVRVFNLPAPLRAPAPVVNDFEDRNVSDLTFSGGQFALATRGSDDVLAQTASNGLAIALASATDWTDFQLVEADITPTYSGTGSWVGLVARYVDADNYYYLQIRSNETYGIYKRVNGVDTLLYESYFYNARQPTFGASLRVSGSQIDVNFSFQQGAKVTDRSLTHGRGGVVTSSAQADFDDLHVAATDQYELFYRQWGYGGSDYVSDLHELSGHWQVVEGGDEENPSLAGLAQTDTSGDARAVIGTPVANQELTSWLWVDSFAPSQTGAWFGMVARYVDAKNYYYVTFRASGQVQIKKLVNGVITVLASANFSAVPKQEYRVRFLVINDQLQLFVDDVLLASAHDADIASGQYGLATYRAAATWDLFDAEQP